MEKYNSANAVHYLDDFIVGVKDADDYAIGAVFHIMLL